MVWPNCRDIFRGLYYHHNFLDSLILLHKEENALEYIWGKLEEPQETKPLKTIRNIGHFGAMKFGGCLKHHPEALPSDLPHIAVLFRERMETHSELRGQKGWKESVFTHCCHIYVYIHMYVLHMYAYMNTYLYVCTCMQIYIGIFAPICMHTYI